MRRGLGRLAGITISTDDVFFSKTETGKPDVAFLKDHFYREGRIKEEHALYIINKATALLRTEPNVLTIDRDAPVKVCGSIHGQYYDLMTLFELGGHPSNTRYLFLGGYTNIGNFSIECLLYLWTLKIWYPNTFFLLRGCNERRRSSEGCTFEIECKHKYSERVYEACLESFCTLPLAAIIAERFFCVHGGISPELHTIDDIRKLNRFHERPTSGLMWDILLSVPIKDFGQERTTENFVHNVQGGYCFYTYKAVCDFLERNRLVSIIRANRMSKAGYRTYRKRQGNPSVITVLSAPNCGGRGNKAAVLTCHGKEYTVQQFNWTLHPYRIPKFMDAFNWSLPFICEKVMDMLAVVLYIYFLELIESIENSTLSVARVDRNKIELLEMLQNKIHAVRCISYMFSVFRVGSEHMSELKTLLRSSSLNDGVLSLRAEDIKNAIKSVKETRLETPEIQDIEKQLRVKERHLQIREAGVQDVGKMLQVKERELQIREAEIQKMLQAVNERRAAMDLQEDNIRQRLAAMKEWEENPSMRLKEAALTQQVSIAWQPNRDGAAQESDLFSLFSLSTVRNSPRIRSNVDVDVSPGSNAKLNQDLGYRGNELASLASTTRAGPSEYYTNIDSSSSKSHAWMKEDSEYYSNE